MKQIGLAAVFLLAGRSGVSAQQAADSMPASGTPPVLLADSLLGEAQVRHESLARQMAVTDIRYFVIRVSDGKYGYTVFIDGQLYIEQKSIPSIAGTAGFATTENADRVARRVVDKIRRGEMPPSVSVKDLQEMGVVD